MGESPRTLLEIKEIYLGFKHRPGYTVSTLNLHIWWETSVFTFTGVLLVFH
jgi:hypothetical protein